MKLSPLLDQLIQSLRCLPGVGPKTAQRMAFQLLERGREKRQTTCFNITICHGKYTALSAMPYFY